MTPDGPARPGAILLAAPPVHPPPTGLAADPPLRLLLLFFAYLLLALPFHAAGLNVFHVLIGGGDGFTAGLPSKLFATQLSAWNPYVQLGQYSFANTQFQPFYPPALLILGLFTNTLGYNLFILIHYAFAGLFTYLFVRNLGLGSWACFVGGLTFMLSGFLSAHKGHQAMMSAAIWLPLMLLFVDRFAGNLRLREIASASLAWAMSILAGFPQVTVYAIVVVAAYTVYRVHTSGRRGWHWLLLSASALASVSVIPFPLSITWISDFPASVIVSRISVAPASTAFSSSSFTALAGR